MWKARSLVAGLAATLGVAGCTHAPTAPQREPAPLTSPAAPIAVPVIPALPFRTAAEDPNDGPCISTAHGCIALNPDVDESTIDATICQSGYTKSVRPATSYTNGMKKKLMREAGIDVARVSEYELDHIIPLALGGHPRKPSNLMLQPWDGPQGAKVKDALEVRLQSLVCHGRLDLTDAQVCIATDWTTCAAGFPNERQPRRASER